MISMLLFYLSQLSTLVLSFAYMPVLSFVGYQIIYFMYHPARWWYGGVPSLRYSLVFSLLVLGHAALYKIRGNGLRFGTSPPVICMFLLVAWYGAVNLWAFSPITHAFAFEHFVKTVVIAAAAYCLCDTRKGLDYLMIGYVLGAAYIGYYAYQFGRTGGGRVEGIGMVDSPDVNDVAAMLAPAAVFALHLFWRYEKLWQRVLVVIAGAFIVNSLVLMSSRGAFLGVSLGSAYYMGRLFFAPVPVPNLKAKVIGIGLAGVLGLLYVVDDIAISRFASLREEARVEDTSRQRGSTRIYFWLAAFEMTKDYPLGLGAGGFVLNSHRYIREDVDTGRSRNRAAHSSWFQTLTEVGYPGFALFAGMLGFVGLGLGKARKQMVLNGDNRGFFVVVGVQSACLAYLVAMTFIDRMRAEALYWLVLMGAAAYQIYFVGTFQQKNQGRKR
ncbi:MAG: O-antigen ligase family protein [Congregibacter sp.]